MKELSCQQFAQSAISRPIRRFQEEALCVRRAKGREALHQMRVASRRLRNSLWVLQKIFPRENFKRWIQGIRKVAKVSGQARDIDVQIVFLNGFCRRIKNPRHRAGLKMLAGFLRERRKRIQPRIIQALDDLQRSKIFDDINSSQKLIFSSGKKKQKKRLWDLTQKKIVQRLGGLLAFEQYVYSPQKVKKLHETRIAAKHLRYTLEGFALLYGPAIQSFIDSARDIQRILGELHDYDVWIQTLPRFMARQHRDQNHKDALIELREHCQRERAQAYKKFVKLWESQRSQRTWNQLAHVVTSPQHQ